MGKENTLKVTDSDFTKVMLLLKLQEWRWIELKESSHALVNDSDDRS